MVERQPALFGQAAAAEGTTEAVAAAGAPAPAFEDLVAELERLLAQLESGNLSLEDSLAAFERGMHLSKRAAAILDAAEHRIEQLTGTPEAPVVKPIDDGAW